MPKVTPKREPGEPINKWYSDCCGADLLAYNITPDDAVLERVCCDKCQKDCSAVLVRSSTWAVSYTAKPNFESLSTEQKINNVWLLLEITLVLIIFNLIFTCVF